MHINLPVSLVDSIVLTHLKQMFEIELYRKDEGGVLIDDTEVIEAYRVVLKEHISQEEYTAYRNSLKRRK